MKDALRRAEAVSASWIGWLFISFIVRPARSHFFRQRISILPDFFVYIDERRPTPCNLT